jgi:D-serine deaminase-like pyridoxal phosphate-dependent protein
VAKLSEAEMMIGAGITDILVTTGIVDPLRIRRLVALAGTHPTLRAVTRPRGELWTCSLRRRRRPRSPLSVLVDINCGSNRSGVAPGAAALALAQHVARKPSLRLEGFQAFASHVMHMPVTTRGRRASLDALAGVVETRRIAERAGLDVPILSVGGTRTWDVDCDVEGVTDVQVGSYLFMDAMYRAIGGKHGPVFDDFEPALFVLTTAISQPVAGEITVDAGYKASATDHQAPDPWGVGQVTYRWAGDEHGILTLLRPSRRIKIGDRILMVASHCDPTVNLYDSYWVCSGERVVAQWPVTGRGMSQ